MKLAKWFINRLNTIKKHNRYESDWNTTEICNTHDKWTPCDLIAREYLNNNGGSAKGFLGISRAECIRCYDYMVKNRNALISMDYVNAEAWNNSGITLWKHYNF